MRLRCGPAGIHLFNRDDGINVLLDEFRVPSSLWARAPRHVSIALLNACDLDCEYCYAPKSRQRLRLDQLIPWLAELDENGSLGIGFGGGEPTLHSDFIEVCRYVARHTGMAVSFTTHGHRLTDELLSKLEGNVHFVRVSMDGVGDTYESLRGRSFNKLCDIFKGLRHVARFGINYVVNRRTLPDLDAAVGLATAVEACEFLLLPEQANGRTDGIDKETSEALHAWVGQYRGDIPLSISEAGADGLAIADPLSKETGLRAHAHVSAAGLVKLSSFSDSGVPIRGDGILNALAKLKALSGKTNQ